MVGAIDRPPAAGSFTQRPENHGREDKPQQGHIKGPNVAQRDLGGRKRTRGQELLKDDYGIEITGTV